ncbi:hypothetical protein EMIT043CA1_80165 [Pseudomonas brassicacearum]
MLGPQPLSSGSIFPSLVRVEWPKFAYSQISQGSVKFLKALTKTFRSLDWASLMYFNSRSI